MTKTRRTLLEHRLLGRLSITELFVYSVIRDEAKEDYAHHRMPDWAALCHLTSRQFTYVLGKLVRGGWLERKVQMPIKKMGYEGGRVETYLRVAREVRKLTLRQSVANKKAGCPVQGSAG